MSKTPRTDKVKMTALTERNYDKIKCVPVELSYRLETELADKDRQLTEALANCAATSCKLSEAFDELVAYELRLAERDKLIQQVEELLSRIDALEETLLDNKICVACLNPLDNCTCEAPL